MRTKILIIDYDTKPTLYQKYDVQYKENNIVFIPKGNWKNVEAVDCEFIDRYKSKTVRVVLYPSNKINSNPDEMSFNFQNYKKTFDTVVHSCDAGYMVESNGKLDIPDSDIELFKYLCGKYLC